jgi:hypothetical protein
MRLRKLLNEILKEQEEVENVIEFPHQNFIVTIDQSKKKLIFAPEGHSSVPNKIRTIVQMLRQNFHVLRVNSLEDENDYDSEDDPKLRGVFEVEFDPRENFDEVVNFVRQQEADTI